MKAIRYDHHVFRSGRGGVEAIPLALKWTGENLNNLTQRPLCLYKKKMRRGKEANQEDLLSQVMHPRRVKRMRNVGTLRKDKGIDYLPA